MRRSGWGWGEKVDSQRERDKLSKLHENLL